VSGMFEGERAVVAGYRASGQAAAAALLGEGAEVWVTEILPVPEDRVAPHMEGAEGGDVQILWGGHRPEHLDGATLLVLSPGVPEHAPIIRWARRSSLPVWSELELGARLCRVPYIAVTGTNGKTTTVELVASMMRAGGLSARACGNVGYPFSQAARESFDALVVEASSFQLRFTSELRPRVSVLLNLAPDHLDWHGSIRAYAEAKARIFAGQREGDIHVGNRDEAEAERVSRTAPCDLRWFGTGPPAGPGDVGIVRGALVSGSVRGSAPLGAPGEAGEPPTLATLLDGAAASAAALAFGLSLEAIRSALAGFVALPHRGTVVATVGSVRFIDDSKATNPHAALASLAGRTGAVLIAGGLAKGVDLSPLAAAAPSLTAVVAIGQAAPAIADVFRGLVPVHRATSIAEAVGLAFGIAHPRGDVVLAPACASQDMFRDYTERGDLFAAAARAIAPSREAPGGRARPAEPRRSHA
jgi:UDP-N-acetylmuramoylalanine--D-glutamate ligase